MLPSTDLCRRTKRILLDALGGQVVKKGAHLDSIFRGASSLRQLSRSVVHLNAKSASDRLAPAHRLPSFCHSCVDPLLRCNTHTHVYKYCSGVKGNSAAPVVPGSVSPTPTLTAPRNRITRGDGVAGTTHKTEKSSACIWVCSASRLVVPELERDSFRHLIRRFRPLRRLQEQCRESKRVNEIGKAFWSTTTTTTTTPSMYSMRDCEWCKHERRRLTPVAAQLDCAAFVSWMTSTSPEEIADKDPDRTTCLVDTLKSALRDTQPSRVPANRFPASRPGTRSASNDIAAAARRLVAMLRRVVANPPASPTAALFPFPPPPPVSPRTRMPHRSQYRGAYLKRRDGRLILCSFTGDTPALDHDLQITIKQQKDKLSSPEV